MALADRPYEVVIWGATGFTGRLVAEHAATSYQGGAARLRWAIAGRDAAKLEEVKKSLVAIDPSCKDVPVLLADIRDQASVDKMVASTQVVLATAGPFTKLGRPIVDAAVRQGTHYVDITGEVLWVKSNIDTYHEEAEKKGAKIVSMCGYDSCPSDLGTLMMVDHIKEKLGKETSKVTTLVEMPPQASMSGGTVATIMLALSLPAAERNRSLNLNLLVPPGAPRMKGNPAGLLVGWNKDAKKWTSPWLMGLGNTQVVLRSSGFRHYGDKFTYEEIQQHDSLPSAVGGWLTLTCFIVGLATRPGRYLLSKVLPKPGEGPSRKNMMDAQWRHTIIGTTQEEPGTPQQTIIGEVSGKQDVGYWMTARMLLEAGVCLARQGPDLEKLGYPKGGVLTPATAMGHVLITRLRSAGFTLKVHS